MSQIDMLYGFPCFSRSNQFSNFKNQKLRVSDIWGFWEYVLRKQNTTSERRTFLKSLLEQSRYFYEAAEQAPIKSQPLLYYYSFLNLAKIVISIDKNYDSSKEFYHGIETKVTSTTTFDSAEVVIKQLDPNRVVSVANIFAKTMGDDYTQFPAHLKISECMKSCVALHRTYCEIFGISESYFRLDNAILNKSGKDLLFTAEIHNCTHDIMQQLQGLNYNIQEEGQVFKLTESFRMPSYYVGKESYVQFAKQIRQKGLWYYMTQDGIRLYVSTQSSCRYSMEAMIYNVMFFFGSITRYHPYFFDSILNKEQYWVVSEFLKTMPQQFLYLVTSKALGISIFKSRLV